MIIRLQNDTMTDTRTQFRHIHEIHVAQARELVRASTYTYRQKNPIYVCECVSDSMQQTNCPFEGI